MSAGPCLLVLPPRQALASVSSASLGGNCAGGCPCKQLLLSTHPHSKQGTVRPAIPILELYYLPFPLPHNRPEPFSLLLSLLCTILGFCQIKQFTALTKHSFYTRYLTSNPLQICFFDVLVGRQIVHQISQNHPNHSIVTLARRATYQRLL